MKVETTLRLYVALILLALAIAIAACDTITGGEPPPCELVRADTTWTPAPGGDSLRIIVEQYCREAL